MRLPYAPSTPPPTAAADEKAVYEAVSARRAPRPLQPLDLALLHSPPVASGWNAFLGAIRSRSSLPGASVQEVAICRIAVLNRAPYEWDAHSVLAIGGGREKKKKDKEQDQEDEGQGEEEAVVSAEGMRSILTAEEFVGPGAVGRLTALKARLGGGHGGTRREEAGLTARQWAVVAFADQSTRNVQVEDGIWAAVKEEFGDREMVELTATVAAYNCVSRFLAALDVGERNGATMEVPDGAK